MKNRKSPNSGLKDTKWSWENQPISIQWEALTRMVDHDSEIARDISTSNSKGLQLWKAEPIPLSDRYKYFHILFQTISKMQ